MEKTILTSCIALAMLGATTVRAERNHDKADRGQARSRAMVAGGVYTMDNAAAGNNVWAFQRLPDPVRWVKDHGDFLYACAMLRLRDSTKAKDAVQETFLAALRSRGSCHGKSGERGWLVGILKHKICDHYRKTARETLFRDLDGCLSPGERLGMKLHLMLCRWCRRYGRQIRFLHEALCGNKEKLGTCSHVQLPNETREQLKGMMSRNPD